MRIALYLLVFSSFMTLSASTTQYRYDKQGLVSEVVYSNGKIVRYSYDLRGNQLSRQVITLCYNFQSLRDNLPNWPQTQTVQSLVAIVACP